jgi:ABC-type branched-subunit amino acid transport system ATPase component
VAGNPGQVQPHGLDGLGGVAGAQRGDEHVRQLASGGAAVLIVEQRARAVLAISERTYVLGGGEVRMEGSPVELATSPDFIESFLGGGRERGSDRGTGAPA